MELVKELPGDFRRICRAEAEIIFGHERGKKIRGFQ